jgi:GTP cyclohydrolase II
LALLTHTTRRSSPNHRLHHHNCTHSQKQQADGGLTHTEPCAILTGRPEGGQAVPVRVHDACFTSEVLGSMKCDCADQLRLALDYIAGPDGPGLVIYLQQEGRGIGLANKIAAYALQEGGLDTVDANRALGLPDDAREYSSVAAILADLGIASVRLMTNNPRKVELLRGLGVAVVGRIPCLVQAQEHSVGYLLAKAGRMSHLLAAGGADDGGGGGGGGGNGDGPATPSPAAASPIPSFSPMASADEELALDGSFCYWDHGGEPLAPSAGDGGSAAVGGAVSSEAPEPPPTPPLPPPPGRLGRASGRRLVSLDGGE